MVKFLSLTLACALFTFSLHAVDHCQNEYNGCAYKTCKKSWCSSPGVILGVVTVTTGILIAVTNNSSHSH